MKIAFLPLLAALVWPLPLLAADPPPPVGSVFQFSPGAPKHVTTEIEFRDPSGEKWPVFLYGKPSAEGAFTFNPAKPQFAATFTFDKMPQKGADQSRKVIGELIKTDAPPIVMFAAKTLGPFQTKTIEGDKPGKTKQIDVAALAGELTVGTLKVPLQGELSARYARGKDATAPTEATFEARFLAKPSQLGLRNLPAERPIQVIVRATGYAAGAAPIKK